MSIAIDRPKTLEELVERLGAISLARIRCDPLPGTATIDDVVQTHDQENRLFELVDAVLVEKSMGFYESVLAGLIVHFVQTYLEKHDRGVVAGEGGMVELSFSLVRIPDVSFVSWERLAGREIVADPVPRLVPNLAVEVISEGNTPKEMNRKLRDYFHAGVELVWFVYPRARYVEVYSAADRMTWIDEEGVLDGGDVLPGFRLAIKVLFARAERKPADRHERRTTGGGRPPRKPPPRKPPRSGKRKPSA